MCYFIFLYSIAMQPLAQEFPLGFKVISYLIIFNLFLKPTFTDLLLCDVVFLLPSFVHCFYSILYLFKCFYVFIVFLLQLYLNFTVMLSCIVRPFCCYIVF